MIWVNLDHAYILYTGLVVIAGQVRHDGELASLVYVAEREMTKSEEMNLFDLAFERPSAAGKELPFRIDAGEMKFHRLTTFYFHGIGEAVPST